MYLKKQIVSLLVAGFVVFGAAFAGAAERTVVKPAGFSGAGPYSPGIVAGDLVFTSGQLGLDASGKLAEGLEAQTKQALDNLKAVVEAAGSGMDKLVKVTIYMKDIKDYAKVNEIYGGYFNKDFPARTAVQAANLPLGGLIEIEAVALK